MAHQNAPKCEALLGSQSVSAAPSRYKSLDEYKTRQEITNTWYMEKKVRHPQHEETQRLVLSGFQEDPAPDKPKAFVLPDWSDGGNPELRTGSPALGGPWV